MARIYIEPSRAKRTAQDELDLSRALKAMSQEVDGIRSNMRYKIAGRAQIAERLRQVSEQIAAEAGAARNMGNGLQQIVAWYEKTENGNRDSQTAEKAKVRNILDGWSWRIDPRIFITVGPDGKPPKPSFPSFVVDWDKIRKILEMVPIAPVLPFSLAALTFLDGVDYDPEIASWKSADGRREEKATFVSDAEVDLLDASKDSGNALDRLRKWGKDHTKTADAKYYIDGKTGKFTKIDPKDKAADEEFSDHNKGSVPVDIRLAGVGTSGSTSWLKDGIEGEGDIGGGSLGYDIFKGEYNSDAYIGVLGIGASAGASFSAFTAEAKGYLGTENTQVYGEIEATIGRVGAQGGASVGLVDKNGNFNPSAYVDVSAEAIAGEVSGSVGGKIAGTDISATGKLNFGVGAHANVGIHDGKISVDLGASLGVGVGVKVDIDVSGTIKAIGSGVSKVGSFLKKLF